MHAFGCTHGYYQSTHTQNEIEKKKLLRIILVRSVHSNAFMFISLARAECACCSSVQLQWISLGMCGYLRDFKARQNVKRKSLSKQQGQ